MAARCTEGFLLQQLGPKAWQRKWCKVTTNGELHCFAKENSAKPPQLTLPLPKFLLAQGAVTKTKLGTSLHQIVLHGDTDTFTFAAEGLELFDDWFEALEMFALSMPAEPNGDQNPTPGVANAKEDKPGPSVPAENLPTSPAASQSHVEKRASQNLARLLKAEARLKADNVELQALVQQQEQQIVVLARRLKGLPAGEVEVCHPAVDLSKQREVDSLQTEVSQLRARVAELEAALAVVHSAGEHDKERVETMSGELDAARSAQGKLRNELQRITAELADEKSKNELLAAQLKALQGQGNSTRPAPPKRVTVSPPPQTQAPQPTPQLKQSPTPQPKQSPTPQPKQSPIAQPTQSPSTAEPAARTRRSATMAAPRRVSIVSLKDVTQHECVHCHLVVGGEGKRLKSGGVVHPECLAHAKQAAKEMAAGTCICCGEPLVKVKGKFSGDTMDLGDGELHKECRKAWREKKSHEAHKHAKVCLHCSEPIAPVPGRFTGVALYPLGDCCHGAVHKECKEAFDIGRAPPCARCGEPACAITGRFSGRTMKIAGDGDEVGDIVHAECWDEYMSSKPGWVLNEAGIWQRMQTEWHDVVVKHAPQADAVGDFGISKKQRARAATTVSGGLSGIVANIDRGSLNTLLNPENLQLPTQFKWARQAHEDIASFKKTLER